LLVATVFFVLLCFVSFFGDYRRHFFDTADPQPGAVSGGTLFALAVLFFNGICAGVGGLLLLAVDRLFRLWNHSGAKWNDLVWGTLAISIVYSLVIILHLGLFGRNLPDDRREWWSRTGAVFSLWMVAWLAGAGMAIYGPLIMAMLLNYPVGHYLGVLLGSSWFATTVSGVIQAQGDKTGPKSSGGISDLIARIAPPVFVAGLLLLVSFGAHLGTLALLSLRFPAMKTIEIDHFAFLSWWLPLNSWIAAVVCMSMAAVLSWRVDVNQFSMHNFYENRLVRCYLGASRRHRKPNRFTGFDPDDDFALASLAPNGSGMHYHGPYPSSIRL